MSDVVIYGAPQSTYTRTARLACHEKGVAYQLVPLRPHAPELAGLHPFGRIPAFRHADLVIYETGAITRYIDEAFAGPHLQPDDVVGRARMSQWQSVVDSYVYPLVAREILLPRFGVVPADEARIAAAGEQMAKQLRLAEEALHNSPFLAGERLSLADLYLAPLIFWLEKTPEGQAALPGHAALGRWYQALAARESFVATVPPMPGEQAA